MKKLLEPCQILISYYYYSWANPRMSRKTSPVPPVLENAHIHKLLFKCAKTCSKPGQQDTHFVLPICAAYTNHLINGWSATFIYKNGQSTNA